jgi:hypothetical protein
MRRYIFYLAVGLLAFGIGSFVVFNFYLKTENISLNVSANSQTNFPTGFGFASGNSIKKQIEMQGQTLPIPKKKITNFGCNDRLFTAILSDLKREKDFALDAGFYLNNPENSSDCRDILFIEQLVDLNGDGKKELVVRGKNGFLCGVTGNCSTWIYEKVGNKYKKLLDTGGEILKVKKGSANGYKNIFVSVHDSCCSSYLYTYKFNGKKYKEVNCLFEDYGITGERSVMTCAEKSKQYEETN